MIFFNGLVFYVSGTRGTIFLTHLYVPKHNNKILANYVNSVINCWFSKEFNIITCNMDIKFDCLDPHISSGVNLNVIAKTRIWWRLSGVSIWLKSASGIYAAPYCKFFTITHHYLACWIMNDQDKHCTNFVWCLRALYPLYHPDRHSYIFLNTEK